MTKQTGREPNPWQARVVSDHLTQEQRAEFLAAYRNTFLVRNHAGALKSLYGKFSRRFGVRPAILRAIALEDSERNRKRYAKLRNAAASLRSNDQPPANKPTRGRRARNQKSVIDPVNTALPASPYAATTGRLDDTAKSSPKGVRAVIGGGSPGLGKNAK